MHDSNRKNELTREKNAERNLRTKYSRQIPFLKMYSIDESLPNNQNKRKKIEERSLNCRKEFISSGIVTESVRKNIISILYRYIKNTSNKLCENYEKIIIYSKQDEKYLNERVLAQIETVTELIYKRLIFYYLPKYCSLDVRREEIKHILLNLELYIQEPLAEIMTATKIIIALIMDANHKTISSFIFDLYKDTTEEEITESKIKTLLASYGKMALVRVYMDDSCTYNRVRQNSMLKKIEFEENIKEVSEEHKKVLIEACNLLIKIKVQHNRAFNTLFQYFSSMISILESERRVLSEYKYSTIMGELITSDYKKVVCYKKMLIIMKNEDFLIEEDCHIIKYSEHLLFKPDSALFKDEWLLENIKILKERLIGICIDANSEDLIKSCERRVKRYLSSKELISEESRRITKEKGLIEALITNLENAMRDLSLDVDEILNEPISPRFYLLEHILEKSLWIQEYLTREILFLEAYMNNYEINRAIIPLCESLIYKNNTQKNFIYSFKNIDRSKHLSNDIINKISKICGKCMEGLEKIN